MVSQFSEISAVLESWYRGERGCHLLEQLQRELDRHLETAFGYHILQIGPVHCGPLFGDCRIDHRICAGSRPGEGIGLLCESSELPLESDSVDVIIAHHALEFADQPHQVLRELQRVLMPHGQLLITGWNPLSLHGLGVRVRALSRRSPWRQHRPVTANRLTDWLNLLGCEVEEVSYLYNLPPFGTGRVRDWLQGADQWCSGHRLPLGGLYLVRAFKQVAALHRPRPLEKLIGLTVPHAVPAANPAPSLPAVGPVAGAARGRPRPEVH